MSRLTELLNMYRLTSYEFNLILKIADEYQTVRHQVPDWLEMIKLARKLLASL